MISSGSLAIRPDAIVFRDLDPGESDSTEVWARNGGTRPIRIRFSLPENPFFSLSAKPNQKTAPGLDARATVYYTASTTTTETCELKVECDDATVYIPITAHPPSPAFQINKTHFDYGTMLVGSSKIDTFTMKNCGTTDGKFKIICKESGATITPESGILKPNEIMEVSVAFKSIVAGSFDFAICPEVEGMYDPLPSISASAVVVDHSIMLLGEDNAEIKELTFGRLFFGQKKSMKIKIANKGALARKFTIEPPSANRADAPIVEEKEERMFTVSQIDGTLGSYTSTEVTVTFAPPPKKLERDVEEVYTHYMHVNIVETGQLIELTLVGTAVRIGFDVTAVDFNFDPIVVKQKQTQTFTLTNTSKFLPLTFSMKQAAHFTFSPESGVVEKEQSQEISVTFFPKSLGPYECQSMISICNGLGKRAINLSANVITDSDGKSFKRTNFWEDTSEAAWSVKYPASRFGLTLPEIEQKKTKRKIFDSYITEQREKREEITTLKKIRKEAEERAKMVMTRSKAKYTSADIKEFVDKEIKMRCNDAYDPVNMGLGHCEGMIPPDPPLRKVAEPFKFDRISNPRTSTAKSAKKQEVFDDRILMKKKFKPQPTTTTEIAECSKTLLPEQQLLVVASHETIDFGTVSVFSTEVRSFQVTNNLQSHILVTMKYECEELSSSTPHSQVVPPHQTCGFDIVLKAQTPQRFNKAIQYVINNEMSYSVNVAADIVPIDVTLSPSDLTFEFPEDYARPYIKEFVTLKNNSNSVVEFRWTGFDSVFTTHNFTGTICPHGKYAAEITYRPDNNSQVERTATLEVKGGPSKTLFMVGKTGKAKFVLNKKTLPFGLIPMATPQTMDLRVKNTGPDDGIFTITPNLTDVIQITPASGRIKVGEYADISVRVNCMKAGAFEIPVAVGVCGGNAVSFTITGHAEVPKVALTAEPLEYGLVYVGSSLMKKLTLKNTGCIPAVVFVDLSKYADFHLDYESTLNPNPNAPADKCNSIALVTNMKSDTSVSMLRSSSQCSAASFSSIGDFDGQLGFIYRIRVMEGSSVDFSLVFQPRYADNFSFNLPVRVENTERRDVSLRPQITAKSLLAPLFLSDSSIDFGVCPLFDAENPNNRPPLRQLVVKNEYKQDVRYRVGKPSLDVFTVEPMAADVKYATSTTMFITFRPTESRPFSCFLPIYVITDTGETLVSEVQLTGVGSCRRFKPSISYVSLPVVPLGVKSERVIKILNSGSIRAELKTDMPIIEKQFPLSVQFVEGSRFEFSTRELPLKISFSSQKPMSFQTLVAIVDDQGGSASITVSAATDNSIFTLYPVLSTRCYKIASTQGKAITASVTKGDLEDEYLARVTACPDFINFKASGLTVNPAMTEFLVKYLNAAVLSTKVKKFPDDFANSGGELVLEMIANLAGSKKPVSLGSVLAGKGKDSMAAMKSLLQFLKTQGAILPNVAPEFLLRRGEFSDIMRNRIIRNLLGLDYYGAADLNSFGKIVDDYITSSSFTNSLVPRLKSIDKEYKNVSTEAWTQVILQVLKLYSFSKIEPDKFSQILGVSQALAAIRPNVDDLLYAEINRPMKGLASSNVFTAGESLLLKWVTIHHCARREKYNDLINDFTQLRDPKYFLSVLKSHMQRYDVPIIEDAKTTEEYQKNLDSIFKAMAAINMPFMPNANEIVQGNHIMLAIMTQIMLESLPHFIPSTDVEFEIPMSTREIQQISITNPCRADISYAVRLEGSPNFKVVTDVVELGPLETVDVEIEYFARTHMGEKAILTLVPERPKVSEPKEQRPSTTPARRQGQKDKTEPVVNTSTVVMNLVSNVVVQAPLEIIRVEGVIYSTTKMSFVVKNIVGKAGKFKIIPRFVDVSEDRRNVPNLMKVFLNDPLTEKNYPEQPTLFDSMIQKHQHFMFLQKKVRFEEEDSCETIDFEFVPISLGEFHCFLLFYNPELGEFMYEIVGKSVLPAVQSSGLTMKAESGKQATDRMTVEPVNKLLFQAVAYANARTVSMRNYMSDEKFNDLVQFHLKELQTLFTSAPVDAEFKIENTCQQYFSTPESFSVSRVINAESGSSQNRLPITFSPTSAGVYPVKIILMSKYDVRIYSVKAVGIAAPKSMEIEMITISGKPVTQEIPFTNPSDDQWFFKVIPNGPNCFTFPQRFSVGPKSTQMFAITFQSGEIGKYTGQVTLQNISKEAVYKYTLMGEVTDPPAEAKLQIKCRARQHHEQKLQIKAFVPNGTLDVVSTVPLLKVPSKVKIEDGKFTEPFTVNCYGVRSGVSTGTITLRDVATKSFIWYVVDLKIDEPLPEETILVRTVCRKTVTIKVPINNPKRVPVHIDVGFEETDFYGDKSFTVNPNETKIYSLVFSPLVALKRQSKISFYNSEEGEFIYLVDITVDPPDPCVMSQMSSPIGKFATTFVLLENPIDNEVWVTVENKNPASFQVMCEGSRVRLRALEKKQVEIRYIPSSVGLRETSLIAFKSEEIGDWYYKTAGVGKPPQPLSPVIVEAMMELSSSGQVLFTNPFPRSTRYELSLMTENRTAFKLLTRRRFFTLNEYGEQFQIAFSFSPNRISQFQAVILVTTVGMEPEVRWTFPIIGNTLIGDENDLPPLRGRAGQKLTHVLELPIVGEQERHQGSDYKINVGYPSGYEWMKACISFPSVEVSSVGRTPIVIVKMEAIPRKPANVILELTVENPLEQKWKFPLKVNIARSGVMSTMTIESNLNHETAKHVVIDEPIRQRTHFTCEFGPGSPPEFSVAPTHGVMEASLDQHNELPIEVIFKPTTYGKITRAVLIVDTFDVEYVIEVIGTLPGYVPPLGIKSGRINTTQPESARTRDIQSARRRNIIKENIDKVKVARPKTVRNSARTGRAPFLH